MNRPHMDWQIEKTNLSSRFKELFAHNHWTDCAFRVGVGEERAEVVRCHRLVLAASSPVFEALFYGGIGPGLDPIVEVPDLEPNVFRLMLKYMYCDELDDREWEGGEGGVDEAGQLLYAANKYMLPHLAAVCRERLLERTRVNTLWDVLAYAECLTDQRLLDKCIQVMCQYPGEMWLNNADRVGPSTLAALLDRAATNLSECELVRLVAAWCCGRCEARRLPPSHHNVRQFALQAGLLPKLRLLTLSANELTDVLEPSGLVSEEELRALVTAGDPPLPPTICATRETRARIVTDSHRCIRRLLTKRKQYVYGGRLCTTIEADSRVLLTAVEVYTRIASIADYMMGRGRVSHYDERLTLTIRDGQGECMSRTEVTDARTEFNVTQKVALGGAGCWLRAGERYALCVELHAPGGQYPVCDLAPFVLHRAVRFDFADFAHDHNDTGGGGGAFDRPSADFGFITGLFFSV